MDIDWLANVIRTVDGNHSLGAGALAEAIVAAMSAAPPAESQPQGVEAVEYEWGIAGSNSWVRCDKATYDHVRRTGMFDHNTPPCVARALYTQPPAPAGGDDVQLCIECGQPTMHMGNVCFPCSKARGKLEATYGSDMEQAADAGNPAWWRGHDEACTILCQKVHAILDGRDSGRGVANEPWESTRRRLLAAALRSQGQADAVDEYEFEVWQGGAWQAGGSTQSAEDAVREAGHYALMYGQDGPVELRYYAKRDITAALAQQANKEQPANG